MTLSLFVDGGVIGRNPSLLGGVWAFVLVENEIILSQGSGVIEPTDVGCFPAITNNLTELLAAIRGLEAVPMGWDGILHTDSMVTLHRLMYSQAFNGIPNWLRIRTLELRRNHKWQVKHLAGHPTKAELLAGVNRNGLPVSRWNVHCDRKCRKLASQFLRRTENECLPALSG